MAYDFSGRPYFDRFSSKNNWTFVLFNPDVPLQQSELNESQSILHHYLGAFGDSIFKDGDVQSGLDYTRDKNDVVKLNPGYVYLNGKVRHYKSDDSVKLTGVGKETIGVKIVESIITSDDDSSLLDPTSGVDSYFSSGADRYVEEVKMTLNDSTSATVYTFKDGDLFTRNIDPQFNKIEKVMAQQRYEESGNYKVKGFEIFKEDTLEDDPEGEEETRDSESDEVNIVVDTGLGYVHGYRIDKPTSTRIKLEKSRDLRLAENESAVYNDSQNTVRLANSPVEKVYRVSAEVMKEKERVTRDQVGDSVDYLSQNTAFRIDKVWTETSPDVTKKEYKQGEDYILTDGQTIDWSPGGAEPEGGTSYYVTYRYTRKMTEGTDYKVETEGSEAGKRWFINIGSMEGEKPIDQSVVTIDYTFYLARQDLITLDENGEMHVLQGEPNIKRQVTPPLQEDSYSLELGFVTVLPDSSDVECYSTAISRLTMDSLQKMKTRIDNVEYNQAINALDQDAMEGQNPMTLRSVFSEGFISLDKADVSHPEFAVAFSFEDAEATLQFTTAINEPKIVPGMTDAHLWGRLVSAPFNEERTLYQGQASETMNVNPYNIPNKQGVMKLTPSEDNWIEEDRITVTEQKTMTTTLNRWWRHPGTDYGTAQETLRNKIDLDDGQSWEGKSYAYDRKHGRTGTMLSSGGTRTLDEAIEFIRVRDVKFDVKGFYPYDDNLYLNFDGRRVPITPDSGFSRGTESGTVKANEKGQVKGTFTIPSGVRCGNREVTLKNGVSTSSSTYSAHGRKKTTQDIIIRTRVTINLVDPLAQSFAYDENRVITSVGLYFASKGDKNSNVTIQVRGMGDQGFPTKEIYAETVMNATEIKTSNNASAETRVYFDDPVMAEGGKEYAIVVITESDEYTMWIGTRTQPKIDKPSETISGNPYVEGVLFSSSNASSWTIHQNSDMKFGIYTAKFNETATIEFEELEEIEADRIVLMSTYLTPENTGCLWECKIIFDSDSIDASFEGMDWEPLANYQDIELIQLARRIKLRATFKSNKYVSPLMSVSDLTFTTFLTEMSGSYIARAIDMSEAPYNTLRFIYEAFTPRGAKVIPRYSTDNGTTWETLKSSPKTQPSNNEFTRYTYEEKLSEDSTFKKLQVRLDLSTENSFLRPRVRRLMTTTHNE